MINVDIDSGLFLITGPEGKLEVPIHSFKKKVFTNDIPGSFGGAFGPLNMFLSDREELRDRVSVGLIECAKISMDPLSTRLDLEIKCSDLADVIFGYEDEIREFISGDAYSPKDNSAERWAVESKTYNTADYLDISALSVMLSAFIPVWATFMHQIKNSVAPRFKESSAMTLLRFSDVWTLPSVEKVMLYVSAIDAGSDKSIYILESTCSESAVEIMGHRSIVRKVAPHDISLEAASNLISSIHRQADSGQPGRSSFLKDKPLSRSSASDEDAGYTDIYMISANLSGGQIEEIRFACSNRYRVAKAIFNGPLPKAQLKKDHAFYSDWEPSDLSKIHLLVIEWVYCNRVIPIDGAPYLLFKEIKVLMGVAKTWLIHNGFDYMALAMSSKIKKDASVVFVGSSVARERLSASIKEELDAIWPFKKSTNGLRKPTLMSVAVVSIESAIKDMVKEDLSPCDIDLEKKIEGASSNGVLAVPGNIRMQLASLLIKIQEGPL